MIRADLDLLADPAADAGRGRSCAARNARASEAEPGETLGTASLSAAAPIPAWARASGRAGQGDPLFAAGAGLALLDASLRGDPPAAGALRSRLALKSAAASAKILRLNADEGALRDLRFAVGDDARARGEAASAVARPRRPPSLDPRRPSRHAAARSTWLCRTRTASHPA